MEKITIEIDGVDEALLGARAREAGMGAVDYARMLIERALSDVAADVVTGNAATKQKTRGSSDKSN